MTHTTSRNLRPLDQNEVKRLLAAARGHPDEALLIVALGTGLRRGELLALRWQDSDLTQGTLAIRRTVDIEGHEAAPKTAGGRREIVRPGLLIEVLQQQCTHQDEAKQAAGAAWQERELVCASPSGGFRDPAHLRRFLHEIAERAGMGSVEFHALRQTTTFLLLSLGVPLQVIQDILGLQRATLPFTLTRSGRLAAQREAMVKLDDLFRMLLPEETVTPSERNAPLAE